MTVEALAVVMRRHEGMPILERSSLRKFSEWLQYAHQQGAFVLIDKPLQWTSFAVVAFLRRHLHLRRIGHAGTLDPLATGLLILGIGQATKFLSHFQQLPKTYETTFKLGATTETDDAEAPEQLRCPECTVSELELHSVLQRFRGEIEQIPPRYSAIKYGGRRLHELSRSGIVVTPKPRRVFIAELELLEFTPPYARFRVICSAGTYIRALARDIGDALGCGAYVVQLRRVAIGPYTVEEALRPEELSQYVQLHASVQTTC